MAGARLAMDMGMPDIAAKMGMAGSQLNELQAKAEKERRVAERLERIRIQKEQAAERKKLREEKAAERKRFVSRASRALTASS